MALVMAQEEVSQLAARRAVPSHQEENLLAASECGGLLWTVQTEPASVVLVAEAILNINTPAGSLLADVSDLTIDPTGVSKEALQVDGPPDGSKGQDHEKDSDEEEDDGVCDQSRHEAGPREVAEILGTKKGGTERNREKGNYEDDEDGHGGCQVEPSRGVSSRDGQKARWGVRSRDHGRLSFRGS